VPFKKRLHEYLDRQAQKLIKAGVDVRLNTEVTPDYAESLKADAIICAVGAEPIIPNMDGIQEGLSDGYVIEATDLYKSPERAGQKVAVIGGGLVGIELSIYLKKLGRDVTLIEMADKLVTDDAGMHLLAHSEELSEGMTVMRGTTVTHIQPNQIICCGTAKGPECETIVHADTVVIAVGQKPLRTAALALSNCAPEFYLIGDCAAPKRIITATQQAWAIARDI